MENMENIEKNIEHIEHIEIMKNTIFPFWKFQALFENLPGLTLKKNISDTIASSKIDWIVSHENLWKCYLLGHTPLDVTASPKYDRSATYLCRVYLGIVPYKNMLNLFSAEEQSELKEIKEPLYMFSFLTNPELTKIYTAVDFIEKTNKDDESQKSSELTISPIVFSPMWFYIKERNIEKSDDLKRELKERKQIVNDIFLDFFEDWNKQLQVDTKDWIVDISFLLEYAHLEENPFISLAEKINGICLHISENVIHKLEDLKKKEQTALQAIKAANFLIEFEKRFPKQIKWYDLKEDFSEDITNKKESLSKTDLHSVVIAKNYFKQTDCILLTRDSNQTLLFNKEINKKNSYATDTFPHIYLSIKQTKEKQKEFLKILFERLVKATELFDFWNKLKGEDSYPPIICNCFTINSYNDILKEIESIELQTMNPFFIEDLSLVEANYPESTSELVKDYIKGKEGWMLTQELKDKMLNIDLIPPTRWPAEGEQFPYIGQYFAITASLNNYFKKDQDLCLSRIISVNGPPGTGKTTLLKDYIANVIYNKARKIAAYWKKGSCNDLWENKALCDDNLTIYYNAFDNSFLKDTIIVVSANNNAVENITKELPLEAKNQWLAKLTNSDGYTTWLFNTIRKASKKLNENNCLLISSPMGRSSNIFNTVNGLKDFLNVIKDEVDSFLQDKKDLYRFMNEVVKEFFQSEDNVNKIKEKIRDLQSKLIQKEQMGEEIKALDEQIQNYITKKEELDEMLSNLRQEKNSIEQKIHGIKFQFSLLNTELEIVEKELKTKTKKRLWGLFSTKKRQQLKSIIDNLIQEKNKLTQEIENLNKDLTSLTAQQGIIEQTFQRFSYSSVENNENIHKLTKEKENKLTFLEENLNISDIKKDLNLSQDLNEEETLEVLYPSLLLRQNKQDRQDFIQPYCSALLKEAQEELFINTLKVIYTFIIIYNQNFYSNLNAFSKGRQNGIKDPAFWKSMWTTLTLLLPVISSTFHSVEIMFSPLNEKEIFGNIIVDEAGQASSYMPVGIFHRATLGLVVGDPFQLEPVFTTPISLTTSILNDITNNDKRKIQKAIPYLSGMESAIVTDNFQIDSSVQVLADKASGIKQSFVFDGQEISIGIPLSIHFRCEKPIMEISNKLIYQGLLKHVEEVNQTKKWNKCVEVIHIQENSWLHRKKHCCDKEISTAFKLIEDMLAKDKNADIFVISPFRNTAYELRERLRPLFKNKLYYRVGTIHTFQGKEAHTVLLVLGGQTKGAIQWAKKKPNLLNVAVTRAKKKLVVIGNIEKWQIEKYFPLS